jgi:hypothetical protein
MFDMENVKREGHRHKNKLELLIIFPPMFTISQPIFLGIGKNIQISRKMPARNSHIQTLVSTNQGTLQGEWHSFT